MKTFHVLAALLIAASCPAVADAQRRGDSYPWGYNLTPAQLMDRVAAQIDDDARRGIITRVEAQRLQADLEAVRGLQQRYLRRGLSERERSDLIYRIDFIRHRLLGIEDAWLARRAIQRQSPPFEDVRRPSGLDNALTRRIDSDRRLDDRRYGDSLYQDDGRDMNDLRGPAPDKHEEGD